MSIGFVMESFEQGAIGLEDTGGTAFHWGDADLLVRAVEMIALRQGIGDIMAEGVDRMSKRFGPQTESYNMTVKGQELPMHEPRLKVALGVGYAIAPVGADHCMNLHDTAYVNAGRSIDRVNSALSEDERIGPVPAKVLNPDKLRIMNAEVNWKHFQDCAISCGFYPYDYDHHAAALSGVTGVQYNIEDILDVGARAQTLSRLFNYREGFTVEDDTLPKRVRTAFEEGPLAGSEITDEDFNWAKREFYRLMGWDPETGAPTTECLASLSLTELLADFGLMDAVQQT
jgi:aldehyde:ferredoxin oxidoreductase